MRKGDFLCWFVGPVWWILIWVSDMMSDQRIRVGKTRKPGVLVGGKMLGSRTSIQAMP